MEKHIQNIIDELSNNIIIIEHVADDVKKYKKTIEKYYDYIKQGFEYKELRTCPVYFKFFDREDSYIHQLQLRHFVTNLMFWEPMVRIGMFEKMDETYIVDCTKISADLIKEYIDNKIIIPFRTVVGNRKLNKIIHDMIYNLSRISTDFNIILGLSINVETFIDLSNRNPRFNEIIRTKIDENMQPNEIEKYLDDLLEEQVQILKTEDNLLKPILITRAGIKEKQLAEFSINGGLKPDLDGNTIPIPINSNFLVGGLGNITNYYIDALGGRKSAIMNKTVMGRSGHFSRMIMLLASSIKLNKHLDDCGTVHPVQFNIKTKKHLERLKGRWYRELYSRQYKVLKGDETHLIGQDILVRSPITCASKDICKKCYGELYHTNKDLESIGGYAGAKITEPLSQSILSSKHLLTTQSEKVEFNEEFYKFFTISANEIILNTQNDNLNKYSLLLIKKNIETIHEFDESEFNSYVTIFHVKDKKTGEIYEIQEKKAKELYISPELRELIESTRQNNKDYYEIDLAKIGDDERIFVVEISNNELTKPLYDIMYLLNNKTKRKGYETINKMAQRLLDLLIESKIKSDSVHGEVLIRPLVRSKKNILETPDFSKYDAIHNYEILTVEAALQKHPSVLVSLSFQDLGRQLTNPLTFKKKDPSFIDPLFKERP